MYYVVEGRKAITGSDCHWTKNSRKNRQKHPTQPESIECPVDGMQYTVGEMHYIILNLDCGHLSKWQYCYKESRRKEDRNGKQKLEGNDELVSAEKRLLNWYHVYLLKYMKDSYKQIKKKNKNQM